MNKEGGKSLYRMMNTASNIINRFNPYGSALGSVGFDNVKVALGYPDTSQLTYYDFKERYLRQDIAYRIIKAPVGVTWKDEPAVSDNSPDSSFEVAFDTLASKTNLYKHFSTADLLARIGYYSLLFIGFADGQELDKPPRVGSEVIYLKPLPQPVVEVVAIDTDPTSKRFGAPVLYSIKIEDTGTGQTRLVHHERLLHIAENQLDDEHMGIPALLPIYNRLLGLEKIAGGSPEMYWRGARPGYAASSGGGVMATKEQIESFKETISDFVNNMNRWLYAEDINIQSLAPQVVSPKEHYDVQLQLISAASRIPLRILTGSERGELSSDQDERGWLGYIEERRQEVGKKLFLEPFVQRMIDYKVLPKPIGGYTIYWKPLVVISEKDKAEIADTYASAIKKYDDAVGSKDMIPPDLFAKYILRLDDTVLEQIDNANGKELAEEGALLEEYVEQQN